MRFLRNLILIGLLLGLIPACSLEKMKEAKTSNPFDISYIQDPQTGMCFATQRDYEYKTLAWVPCEKLCGVVGIVCEGEAQH